MRRFLLLLLIVAAASTAGSAASTAGSAAAALPGLSGTDPVSGKHIDIASYRGKPLVVNIWASWCPGCNQEARDLEAFARAHRGAQVLGIDTKDSTSGARAFYAKYRWTHPSVFDPHGDIAAAWALRGLPTTYFIDRHGNVVAQIIGAGTRAQFEQGLALATRK